MRAWATTVMAVVGLLAAVPSALGRASASTNWAGYAVHRHGVSFHRVSGVWREPAVVCRQGRQTFSSYWVGLGGFSATARALEQVGTEVDCTGSGRSRAFAWYELVPAGSVRVGLSVPAGDLIQGQVVSWGRRITVTLRDLTNHRSFSRHLRARVLDTSSAEWILEAPSDCFGTTQCVTLPLADFGSTRFADSLAESSTGHTGSISDPHWGITAIRLVPSGTTYVINGSRLGAGGRAAPSSLRAGGSAFTVSYSPGSGGPARAGAARLVAAGRLVHAGR